MHILPVEKLKKSFCCIGGHHYSGTISIYSHWSEIGQNLLVGDCNKCKRDKSKTLSDDVIEVESLGHLFKNTAKTSAEAGKQLAGMAQRNPGRALGMVVETGNTAVSRNP